MEGSEKIETERVFGLPPPLSLTVGIAINGKTKSKYVVKWALEKFIQEEKVLFKLLHVRPKITTVPTASKLLIFIFPPSKRECEIDFNVFWK